MSYNALLIETDTSGFPTGYKCQVHVDSGKINDSSGKVVPSYYDLLYPCDSSLDDAMRLVGSRVLDGIGTKFSVLPEGVACTIPDTNLPIWLIGASSNPSDQVVDSLDCQELAPETAGQCCAVVQAPMTFWWTDADQKDTEMMAELRTQFNAAATTADTDYEVRYIGAFFEVPADSPRNEVPPSVSSVETQPEPQKKNTVTAVGGLVMAGLIIATLGVAFVLVRRRRRNRRNRNIDAAMSKSRDLEMDDPSDGPTLEVDVMSDDMPNHANFKNAYDVQDEYQTPSSYTFDLANCMKNDIMSSYGHRHFGPTSMAVVPPYPMQEDASDSEADSWAQTDGTVGGLEEHLEEITAEI